LFALPPASYLFSLQGVGQEMLLTLVPFFLLCSYMPISGFHGVLSGFLVGIKQIMPDQELSVFGIARIKAKVWNS